MRRLFSVILGILLFFIFLELGLRIFGFLYINSKRVKNTSDVNPEAIRIVFLGDSWTFGSDAPAGKGYVNIFEKLLKGQFPDKNIQIFNYAYPSSNSSQNTMLFLNKILQIKPHILIALIGINNGWNVSDILNVQKIMDCLYYNLQSTKINFFQRIIDILNKSKLIKLYRIIYYNLILKKEPEKLIWERFQSVYALNFFDIHNVLGKEKSREFLLENYNKAPNYDEFYNLILYTFGNNCKETEEFLRSRNLWFPHLIKHHIVDCNLQDRFIKETTNILERDIKFLKYLCDQNNITFIIQTYPFFEDYVKPINDTILSVSLKYGIYCLDQLDYFSKNFSKERRHEVLNFYHPNEKGHYYMAKNLFEFVLENKIIEKIYEK